MSVERRPAETWGRNLAQALRQIRRYRGLSTAEAADLMGMDRRNYANFEAGKGRLNVARVLQFAQVTDSDAWAILAGVLIGSPRLALTAADNKMALVLFILLGEFESELGEAVREVDTADAVSAFRAAFKALEASAAQKQGRVPADWLEEGSARFGLRPPRLKEEPP
jgi:transcriptional regulator with XRE-family HTH domain